MKNKDDFLKKNFYKNHAAELEKVNQPDEIDLQAAKNIEEDSQDGKKEAQEIEQLTEQIESLRSTRNLREKYAKYCFRFLVCWSVGLLIILLACGLSDSIFSLSDSVLIALIGNTTVNVI